jgi:hypothetical protein
MDENNSTAGTPEFDEAAFDAMWEDAPDEPMSGGDGEPETEGTTEEPQDQQPEAEAEEEGTGEKTGEEATQEEPKAESRSWKLKHNGAEVDADEAKMVELAQKGLDYDRVRGERDTFKNEHPKYADYEKFLGEMAESAGTDVPGLMENVRVSLLLKKAKAEGRTLSEAAAIKQVRESAKAAQAAPEKTEPSEAERRRETIRAFAETHPGVKGEDIPVEVLKEGIEKGDLSGAYDRWENGKLRKDLEGIRKELESLKQSQKNKERSTGSRKSAGSASKDQAFDALWYDDD